MSKIRGKIGECVYCGQITKLTLDHIPPKNLFSDPKPRMITVPCCEECNSQASQDDEYLRLVLNLSEKLENRPRPDILDKIQRSFQKPEKRYFRKHFISSLKEFEVYSPVTKRIEIKLGYTVNFDRVNSVGARIIKGLFFHVLRHKLPNTHDSKALIGDCIDDPFEGFRRAYIDIFLPKMKRSGVYNIDENVFHYCYALVDQDPYSSVWCLIFYQSFIFYGATLPKEFIQTWWPKITRSKSIQ